MGALVTSEPLAGVDVDTHIGRSERPHLGMTARGSRHDRAGCPCKTIGEPTCSADVLMCDRESARVGGSSCDEL